MKIVLASKSPRRIDILSKLGVDFDIYDSDIDESVNPCTDPKEVVKTLALKKAKSAVKFIDDASLIIGADTVVAIDDKIMGKPGDDELSYNMLKNLSGRWHKVYSGICVINSQSGEYVLDYEVTSVKIKNLSEEEIIKYINTGEPLDKAGGYAIQGKGSIFVEKIEGCYYNVVGLPVFKLSNILRYFGVNIL